MRRARWLCLLVGAACALVVFAALTLGSAARSPASAVTVPDRVAGYSLLTGDVSDAPPGRALALYQHGFLVEMFDFEQALVLAADDDVYRRLDAAEARGGRETQGDPGPMLLSPDGASVALGEHDTTSPDVALVDLATGTIARQPVPDARSVRPLAWSPDGRRLAYLTREEPTNPHLGQATPGTLLELNLDSGRIRAVAGGTAVTTAAYTPDGERLAVQHGVGPRSEIALVRLDTDSVRTLPTRGSLAGPQAWSPDGRLLVLTSKAGLRAVEVESEATPVSSPGRLPGTKSHTLLGWTGDREAVLLDLSEREPEPGLVRVVALSLDDGQRRELARLQSDYGIGRFQLASALLPELDTREAGDPDRGPLPTLVRALLALAGGLVALIAAARITRRRYPEMRLIGSSGTTTDGVSVTTPQSSQHCPS